MSVTLTLQWSDANGEHDVTIPEGESVWFGRHKDAHIRLPFDDMTIHRRHAEITWEAMAPVLEVSGRNGVYLDSVAKRLRAGDRAPIAPTDSLTVGSYRIRTRLINTEPEASVPRCKHCERPLMCSHELHCPHCGFVPSPEDLGYPVIHL